MFPCVILMKLERR